MNNENINNAMWLYPATVNSLKDLAGFNFKEVVNMAHDQKAFIFTDPYRKINIDLVFTEYDGKLYISDYYGETMDRETIFYVKYAM